LAEPGELSSQLDDLGGERVSGLLRLGRSDLRGLALRNRQLHLMLGYRSGPRLQIEHGPRPWPHLMGDFRKARFGTRGPLLVILGAVVDLLGLDLGALRRLPFAARDVLGGLAPESFLNCRTGDIDRGGPVALDLYGFRNIDLAQALGTATPDHTRLIGMGLDNDEQRGDGGEEVGPLADDELTEHGTRANMTETVHRAADPNPKRDLLANAGFIGFVTG
jgi:hypothetical protein